MNAKKVVAKKPLTSFFLEKDKREALCNLLKSMKDLYKVYKGTTKDEHKVEGIICSNAQFKRVQLKRFAEYVWNELQNEFYMTADISWNSIWRYQDEFKDFDESGYLLGTIPTPLLDWVVLLKSWTNQEWAREVLNLIKDFNLDQQKPDYVTVFMNDFKAVRNKEMFCSAVLKWTDLIHWSPWKLSLYDNTFQQPRSVHYEDDYNPDVDYDEEVPYV